MCHGSVKNVHGVPIPRPPNLFVVLVLVLDLLGRGKRTDCQPRSKIEDDDEHEDDRGGKLYRAKYILGRTKSAG
jgi:hypothetical protein